MATQSGGGVIVTVNEFDRGIRGKQTKKVEIRWRMFLGTPDENAIADTVERYSQDGWLYVARKESEGLFGLGAHSTLTFTRLARQAPARRPTQAQDRQPAQGNGCLMTLFLWAMRLVILALVVSVLLMLVIAYS